MAANLNLKELDFVDVETLSPVNVHAADGDHAVTYARHHVIANETFKGSEFLQALQNKENLWDQVSFKTNGVALVNKIDGETATIATNRDVTTVPTMLTRNRSSRHSTISIGYYKPLEIGERTVPR